MAAYRFDTIKRRRVAYRAIGRQFLQYLPLACAMYLCAMCAYYIVVEPPLTGWCDHTAVYMAAGHIVSLGWVIYALASSYCMGFCRMHRHLIVYSYIATLLMYCDRWHSFGAAQLPTIWAVGVAGLVLIVYVFYKIASKRYGARCKNAVH